MSGASVHTSSGSARVGVPPTRGGLGHARCAIHVLPATVCGWCLFSSVGVALTFPLLSMPLFLVNTEGAAPFPLTLGVGVCWAVGLWTLAPGADSGDPSSPTPGHLLEFWC